MTFLSANWERISAHFRDDLLEGVATYVAYRYCNLRSTDTWSPREDPDVVALSQSILDELERHPNHLKHNRTASKAIKSCAYVVALVENAAQLVALATDFPTLQEESPFLKDSTDLVTKDVVT